MSTRRNITVIIGTRPEAIKMAPVIRELRRHPDQFNTTVMSTGQHREMLDQALGLFGITPDVDLRLMRPDQTLAGFVSALLVELDRHLQTGQVDWVLGQGDTATVMAAAMASFFRRVRFGHVEAGLRTGNLEQPFPEEFNRRVADMVSTLHFAPTTRSRDNLLRESIPSERILVTGNTVVDALLSVADMPHDRSQGVLGRVPAGTRHVLITAHRRESFGEPFRDMCSGIRDLALRFPGIHFIYPVHLNPQVRKPVLEILGDSTNLHLVEPLDYLEMVHVMKEASLILTDSGGIQEEAPTFGVPVLVMRQTTERPEGVEAGWVELVGNGRDRLVERGSEILERGWPRPQGTNPYGDGQASQRIVEAIASVH
ncbi:MAG: non-hydrolyzing UDP-N-acetylglucosamine 2-epimerase [Limisphaerales bacterium]